MTKTTKTLHPTLTVLALAVFAALAAFGGCASMDATQVDRPGEAYDWDTWDEDSDDQLMRTEFDARIGDYWLDWDGDSDRYITRAEWDAGRNDVDWNDGWGSFEVWDVDDDDRLSYDELDDGLWSALDANDDDMLDQDEWDTGRDDWGWDS